MALAKYFKMTKMLYDLFDSDGEKDQKLEQIQELLQYFVENPHGKDKWISDNLRTAISITLKNVDYLLRSNFVTRTSHLTSNIVENFFSVIRSKVLYPSYYDYCILYRKAWFELVLTFTEGNPVPTRKKNLSKTMKYLNQKNISFKKSYLLSLVKKHTDKEKELAEIRKLGEGKNSRDYNIAKFRHLP